jgi:hypothetical protein
MWYNSRTVLNSKKGGTVLKIILLPLLFTLGTFHVKHSEADRTALWLARSCVGEAGWDAAESGECAAIWHVYGKRARDTGRPIKRTARLYSSAIKRGPWAREWVFGLNRGGEKPKGWPKRLRWNRYRDRWFETLALADLFLEGRIEDPLPSAEHYGGRMDRKNLCPRSWKRIQAHGFVNWFYARR